MMKLTITKHQLALIYLLSITILLSCTSDSDEKLKVNTTPGDIETIANNAGYSRDGGPANAALLNLPVSVVIDNDGNVYISDSGSNVVRKVANRIVTTIAGTGAEGYSGDDGLATEASFRFLHGIAGYTGNDGPANEASLNGPRGVAVDSDGNVYIADTQNSAIIMVAK